MPRGGQCSMDGICMLKLGVLWFREGLYVVGLDSHETWRAKSPRRVQARRSTT